MDFGLSHLSPQNHEIQSINTKASLEKKEEKQNTLRFPWNKTLDKTWRETWQRTQSNPQAALKNSIWLTHFHLTQTLTLPCKSSRAIWFQPVSPIRFASFPWFYALNLDHLNVWGMMDEFHYVFAHGFNYAWMGETYALNV